MSVHMKNGSNLLNVTDEDFEAEVENSNIPVLVDFWADWCGPCKMLLPIMEELSTETLGKLKIVKLNIDENLQTSTKYGIKSLPTMILFNKGSQIASRVGASSKTNILAWIDDNITL